MSKVIRISETVYEKMQAVAVPLEDDNNSVLERALDRLLSDAAQQNGRTHGLNSQAEVLIQDPDAPDDLMHTKIRSGAFGARRISGRNWSLLITAAHEVTGERTDSFASLQSLSPFNMVEGQLEERGYHFIPSARVSIQYRSAPDVWDGCLQMAKRLNLPIEIEFEWPNKEKAAHPGKRGKLSWYPV